ncbi:HAD-IC family P-type ATPase [Candidatus Saccharibacteria bacterium]|nr:HAD-IC family P-type ATPase [Candidatus Saccharibacteria bacterium]MCL1963399.1 HAD-IC family P-type ATPase [Candidatus Saccharibacteria bacterium]
MMNKFSGLSHAEVKNRQKHDLTNKTPNRSSRRVRDILRSNLLTRFNILLLVLSVVVFLTNREIMDAMFGIIVFINGGIGIVQELRAKRMLDQLTILNAPTVKVIRDSKIQEIAVADVVKDDLIKLSLGDQIVADGEILDSENLEIDESLLTGESDPMPKRVCDQVLSGSIVVAGAGIMRADKVGVESYSFQLASKAKKFQRAKSELVDGTNKLLKWISWTLVIVAPIVVWGQLHTGAGQWRSAVIRSSAAIVSMIPEGLVLLTSMAFMLAAVVLARRKVLIQQMPAVETLARVDTLLLDKTGTITEGNIKFHAIIYDDATHFSENQQTEPIFQVLATIASRAKSPTNNAILEATKQIKNIKPAKFTREIPFSSARKYSAIEIDGEKWLFGAPEIIFANDKRAKMFREAQKKANEGYRVLALVKTEKWSENEIGEFTPVAMVILAEEIRDDAAQTLQYFAEQNVSIKIISGDSPLTVAAVARSVNMADIAVFDARELPDPIKSPTKFARIVAKYNVFGRVQPEQKRQIAEVLQKAGHVVAMTGDGVNDALALKKADLGIAMNSGSAATKSVAEIVLLDNKFSHLPRVLSEGRRVIANIERVANLFIIKNVYSLVLALAVTIFGMAYPYLPTQISVVSAFSIGVPAFFLALAPNNKIYKPGFLRRVLQFSIPIGVLAAVVMMIDHALISNSNIILNDRTAGTSVGIVVMIMISTVMIILSRPVKGWKIGLIAFCLVAYAAVLIVPFLSEMFRYDLTMDILPITLIMGGVGTVLVLIVNKISIDHTETVTSFLKKTFRIGSRTK